MRYACVAFDIDGTLLDSAPADLAALGEVLCGQLHRDFPAETLKRCV